MAQIVRIRKCYSHGNGEANVYLHADVWSRDAKAAFRAAIEGRVTNWRGVDRFDWSDEPYESHFVVDINPWNPQRVEKPHKRPQKDGFRVDGVQREVWSNYLNNKDWHPLTP